MIVDLPVLFCFVAASFFAMGFGLRLVYIKGRGARGVCRWTKGNDLYPVHVLIAGDSQSLDDRRLA
jgi:hypothetical protein